MSEEEREDREGRSRDERQETGERIAFVEALHMAYSDLNEASLSFRAAAELENVPTGPKTLRMLRTDLEKMRRLLHTCLTYVDHIERSAIDLNDEDPELP
jgi:hypothetical protein